MTEQEVWAAINAAFRDVAHVVEAERLGSFVTSETLNFVCH